MFDVRLGEKNSLQKKHKKTNMNQVLLEYLEYNFHSNLI
jgi:hypothetical protein